MESHCYILQAAVATNDIVVCVSKSYFIQTGIVSNDVSTTWEDNPKYKTRHLSETACIRNEVCSLHSLPHLLIRHVQPSPDSRTKKYLGFRKITANRSFLPTVRSQGGWLAIYLIVGPSSINTNSCLLRTHWTPSDTLLTAVSPVWILYQIFLYVSYWLVLKTSYVLPASSTPTW